MHLFESATNRKMSQVERTYNVPIQQSNFVIEPFFNNPGLAHIGEAILKLLDHNEFIQL